MSDQSTLQSCAGGTGNNELTWQIITCRARTLRRICSCTEAIAICVEIPQRRRIFASVGIITVVGVSRPPTRDATRAGGSCTISIAVAVRITVERGLDTFIRAAITVIVREITDLYSERMDSRIRIVTFTALDLIGDDIEFLYFSRAKRAIVETDIVD